MLVSKKPMVLVILDGYGYREEQQDNAIFSAKTPVMDALWANRPHTLIDASGLEVGLPDRQMGNSEVGHVNLGAGRIVYQDLTRLDVEIKDRAFFANPVLTGAVDKAKNAGKAVHIMGLLSAGGVHSHEDHIMAMVELAAERGAEKIYLHAFLDGRDTPPRSAESSLKKFEEKFAALGKGRVASIIGRYYAMDRDRRWQRVKSAYDLLTQGRAEFMAENALANRPPLGLVRDFVVASAGAQAHTLDLKINGITPFVDAARIFALYAGANASSTVARLRAAARAWNLAPGEVEAWVAAFHFIQLLRLRHQHAAQTKGEAVDNRIDPEQLNALDRRILKEAFRQARKLQAVMGRYFEF